MKPMPWKLDQFKVAAPVGYKPCQTCRGYLLTQDRHVRCQKYRKAGGYTREQQGAVGQQ